MKKKIFLIILMIFICAGCKARYTLTINKDGTVEENLSASETPDFYDQYSHSSVGRIVSQIQSRYVEDLNAKKYTVRNFIYVNSDSGSTVTKKYSNFKDYIGNSILYSQFTDKINYSEENDKVSISLKGRFSHLEQNQDYVPVDYGVISITVPYKVLENNADEVKGNTYVWNFDSDSEDERELKLVYTKSKIRNMEFNYNAVIIVAILVVLAIVSVIICKKFNTSRKEANKI